MIDRVARDNLALAVRRLASGRMSLYDFADEACRVERLSRKKDCALEDLAFTLYLLVIEIHEDELWGQNHFVGRARLTKAGRRFMARMWLYLKSDSTSADAGFSEHKALVQWPEWSLLHRFAAFDLCGARRTRYKHLRSLRSMGVLRRITPFTDPHEFLAARARRIFFSGSTNTSPTAASH